MSNVEQWEHDEQLAMENERFANYAKQKPHLYGGCDEITTLREQVEKWKSLHESLTKLNEAQERRHEKQVEKLTKERDELKTVPMKYRRMQFNAELQDEVTQLQKKLAALAKQNAKMREVLVDCEQALDECRDYPITYDSVIEALSLPDLATPVLNRIKAEAYREAADIAENIDVYTFVHGGSSYDDGGLTLSSAATAIRAKADELEQSK